MGSVITILENASVLMDGTDQIVLRKHAQKNALAMEFAKMVNASALITLLEMIVQLKDAHTIVQIMDSVLMDVANVSLGILERAAKLNNVLTDVPSMENATTTVNACANLDGKELIAQSDIALITAVDMVFALQKEYANVKMTGEV